MTTDRRTRGDRPPRADGPSTRWLVVASLWLVFVLMPNGVTTWLGFAIVGFAIVRPFWIAAAFAYFVATVAVSTDAWGARGVIFGGALWVVGIAHGLAANRLWLSTLWGRRERGERLLGRGRRPTSTRRPADRRPAPGRDESMPAEAAGLLDGAGTDRSDYLADDLADDVSRDRTVGRDRTGRAARSAGRAARQDALPEDPVDVNTATQRQLTALPGLTRQRAKALLRERDRLGGFSSVDQFAAVAGLQPHELVRLTPVLECSPRPRRPRAFGRRVEL